MIFNLKKKSQIQPFQEIANDPMGSLDFAAASAKILALYPGYSDINSLMRDMNFDMNDVMRISQETTSAQLENSIPDIRNIEQATQSIQDVVPGIAASVKLFNHKKAQGMDPFTAAPPLSQAPEMAPDPASQQKTFGSHQELKDWLLQYASSPSPFRETWEIIQNENPVDAESSQSVLKNFYHRIEMKSPEAILDEANDLFNFIYGKEEDTMILNVPYGKPSEMGRESSNEISEALKKIANKIVGNSFAKKSKPFNFKKTAQHKTQENVIMWGPGQTRIDPFLRQPVSDWHIMERNKGFGLVVDDVWDIDYETIWRENIMDKYSRPYRDNDGNWVGGYIQKRFEVDKNIPETSNYQLKPGELRKPIMPEYGNTESRLQAARAAGDIKGAKDTSKPFNWKEAQTQKKN